MDREGTIMVAWKVCVDDIRRNKYLVDYLIVVGV